MDPASIAAAGAVGPVPAAADPPPPVLGPAPWPERLTPRVLAGMALALVAVTLAAHLDPGRARAPVLGPSAALGRAAWLARGCGTCHALYGLGGLLGPDLTNVVSRRGRHLVVSVLAQGRGAMPRLGLTAQEISRIADYLEAVDRTGRFPWGGSRPVAFPN